MKKLNYVLIFCMLIIGILGCDKIIGGDVSMVKGGTLEFDKSLTVGQAIDNYKYFKKTGWEAIKTDNGRRVVNIKAVIDTDKHPTINSKQNPNLKDVEFQFQFVINQDKSFQLSWCGIAVTKTDGSKIEPEQNANLLTCTNTLKGIYKNSPDI